MSKIVRVSISLEDQLLGQLESLVKSSHYTNRSEFLRDLIRARLVEEKWEKNREAVGTITLVFNHHQRRLSERLTELQHEHHKSIIAATHVHLDRHMCVEMIMVKGRASGIRKLADTLRQQKGVLHANLSISSTGTDLS